MSENDDRTAADEAVAPTKRRYTLAEDRVVEDWYETRHVPWMLLRDKWYWKTVVVAGRVLHRLHPSREIDMVARTELERLVATAGDERARICDELPKRDFKPDWLSDLERLAALGGETGGASLEAIAKLRRWRPEESTPSDAARSMLHSKLYLELEPLLRQAMRDERRTRKVRVRRATASKTQPTEAEAE